MSTTRTVSFCLIGYAQLAITEGDAERAARLLGSADGMLGRVGLHVWPVLRRSVAAIRDRRNDGTALP